MNWVWFLCVLHLVEKRTAFKSADPISAQLGQWGYTAVMDGLMKFAQRLFTADMGKENNPDCFSLGRAGR